MHNFKKENEAILILMEVTKNNDSIMLNIMDIITTNKN